MKRTLSILLLTLITGTSCSGTNSSAVKAKKIGVGVYEQAGWFFDLKQLPTGEDIVPYYTVGKLSDNTISATNPDGSSIEMGIAIYFKVGKKGAQDGEILGAYLESSALNENDFKFPRCLSVCPVNVEVTDELGTISQVKSSYSRSNVFQMQIEDAVISNLADQKKPIRIRIPVSVQNKNTTFEWFNFDLSTYIPELNQ